MLFNSLDFVLFFPLVVVLYFSTPFRFRWGLLLAASYYFYACWKLEYTLLLALTTYIDYRVALAMAAAESPLARRRWLYVSLASNLGMLFVFKYANFVGDNARLLFERFDLFSDIPQFDLLLPVGISFYTFQALSYTIDVYRGRRQPERHLGIFALYISFFPQLVAGPIERSDKLIPQFKKQPEVSWLDVRQGGALILWGFFKKLVIADTIALYVDAVYGDPALFSLAAFFAASYLFAYQIYCDFSGYSDIAVGTALIMGYRLSQNFNRPYAARTLAELWSRWHISLTTWIRDYCYQPLGRWMHSRRGMIAATVMVSVAFGLWHGAAWHFVAYGLFAGLMTAIGHVSRDWRRHFNARLFPSDSRLHAAIQVLVVFHFAVASLILFRVETMSDLALIGEKAWSGAWSGENQPRGFGWWEMGVALAAILVLEAGQWLAAHRPDLATAWHGWPRAARWPIYYALLFGILAFGEFGLRPFIYFQF